MAVSSRLFWQECVSLSGSDGEAVVSGPAGRFSLRALTPELQAALESLAPPGEDEARLEESLLAAGVDSLARWYYHVDQLRHRGFLRRTLLSDGLLLAELVPLGRSASTPRRGLPGARMRRDGDRPLDVVASTDLHGSPKPAVVLSRFAYLRRHDANFVLESPLAHARVILHDARAIAVVSALATPATVRELARRFAGIDPDAISRLIAFLDDAEMLAAVTIDGSSVEDSQSTLESWEFHDLLFHTRSRRGRSDGQFGGTYRLSHRPPPRAVKELWCGIISAPSTRSRAAPARGSAAGTGPGKPALGPQLWPRTDDGRAAWRVPVSRGARWKRRWQGAAAAPTGSVTMDFTERPYPGGGGLYELEFYPIVHACRDIAAGLYHYDPELHRLERLSAPSHDVELLLYEAGALAGVAPETLQVLIVLAARFERLAWKYESIAYSLVLKDVGVVYQSMYLAATAMRLAPCALGCGDSDLFAQAAGTDYYAETSVGEFLLGSEMIFLTLTQGDEP